MKALMNAKDERMKRKRPLYYHSIILIFFVMLLILALLVTPFVPEYFYIGDIFMDLTIVMALLFWWSQWKESVYLHI
jgi:hypothetical protein